MEELGRESGALIERRKAVENPGQPGLVVRRVRVARLHRGNRVELHDFSPLAARRQTTAASSRRDPTCNFRKMLAAWFATVRDEVRRLKAISSFDRPATMERATSASAVVRDASMASSARGSEGSSKSTNCGPPPSTRHAVRPRGAAMSGTSYGGSAEFAHAVPRLFRRVAFTGRPRDVGIMAGHAQEARRRTDG